jgi:hypothetical protein
MTRLMRTALAAVLCLCAVTVSAQAPASRFARSPEAGGLALRNYPPEVYDGGGQYWMTLQDATGILYVAATNGVLEYDGVTWRRITTPTRSTVRSLAADAQGRIWVGAVGDLGYLERDARGGTRFVSLLDKVPADVSVFEDVWRVFATPEGIYRGFELPNGTLALTTTAAGMVIIDRDGHLLERIDQSSGLLSQSVYYAMPDREGGLWLSLSVGMARVEPLSPFSILGVKNGIDASPSDLVRHDGRLYIAHNQGVQYLKPRAVGTPETVRVKGVANKAWGFKEFVDPEGLLDLVRASKGQSATVLVDRVFDAIDACAGAAPQFDDITLFVVRRTA